MEYIFSPRFSTFFTLKVFAAETLDIFVKESNIDEVIC